MGFFFFQVKNFDQERGKERKKEIKIGDRVWCVFPNNNFCF